MFFSRVGQVLRIFFLMCASRHCVQSELNFIAKLIFVHALLFDISKVVQGYFTSIIERTLFATQTEP